VHGQLRGLGQAYDAGDILSAGALAALVASAHQQRLNGRSAAHEHGADALGPVHLVGADGEQMAAEAAHIELDLARALHGVDVEEDAGSAAILADLFDGLQRRRSRCWPA
jgi:hypothetical protein